MGPVLVHSVGGEGMKQVTITVEDYLYVFYKRIGQNAGGLSPEKVMADALFKLAGELSCDAIHKQTRKKDIN